MLCCCPVARGGSIAQHSVCCVVALLPMVAFPSIRCVCCPVARGGSITQHSVHLLPCCPRWQYCPAFFALRCCPAARSGRNSTRTCSLCQCSQQELDSYVFPVPMFATGTADNSHFKATTLRYCAGHCLCAILPAIDFTILPFIDSRLLCRLLTLLYCAGH